MKRLIIVLVMMIGIIVLNSGNVKGAESMIEKGKKVSFDYVLTVDGREVDSSKERGPLTYTHGDGDIVSGLEQQLNGLKVGDQKAIVVSAEEGYGQIDPKAFQEVAKAQLPPDMQPQAGDILTVKTQDGRAMPVVVTEVLNDTVVLNFNHPLAGKELHFDVTIVEIK